jgi:peroxin-6
MEAQNGVHPRKRRRRRRDDKPAISARLLVDERVKGEVGVLSEDLFDDLFPGFKPLGMLAASR